MDSTRPAPTTDRSRHDSRHQLALAEEVLDGKYRLLRPLKRGSMGEVFAAENLSLSVPVAVKVVRADVPAAAKAEIARRMMQEAHAAFQLDHPAILRVLDVGVTERGDPYVVMEMLRGQNLESAMSGRGPIDPAQSVRVLLPIAHALAAAHACNLVHRDVKPSNVFLARTGDGRTQPKLIDFGLAKAVRPTCERITQEGNMVGSPSYMAPEQILGEDLTGQVDVWGLSVTLYEMLTGELPFTAPRLEALFACVLHEPPTPLRAHGVEEDKLWEIIRKGLAKDPKERWASMKELGTALAEWLIEQGYHDDICAASLASTWLSSGQDPGVKDLLFSPKTPPHRPSRSYLPSLSEAATGNWQRAPKQRRRWLLWLLIIALLAALAAGVLAALRLSPQQLIEQLRQLIEQLRQRL